MWLCWFTRGWFWSEIWASFMGSLKNLERLSTSCGSKREKWHWTEPRQFWCVLMMVSFWIPGVGGGHNPVSMDSNRGNWSLLWVLKSSTDWVPAQSNYSMLLLADKKTDSPQKRDGWPSTNTDQPSLATVMDGPLTVGVISPSLGGFHSHGGTPQQKWIVYFRENPI